MTEKKPGSMFQINNCLVPWRLVIQSLIGLIDELFTDDDSFVLIDSIEVILQFVSLWDILVIRVFYSLHVFF